jgi:hypothetical protein
LRSPTFCNALRWVFSWWHWGPNPFPLFVHLIGVAVAWAVVLGIAWLRGGPTRFNTFALACGGFALGMLAMYIAVHVYRPCSLIRATKIGKIVSRLAGVGFGRHPLLHDPPQLARLVACCFPYATEKLVVGCRMSED